MCISLNFFDLHSDLPTYDCLLEEKLNKDLRLRYDNIRVINAIYKGNRTFYESDKIASEFFKAGSYLAFEDVCYDDFFLKEGLPNFDLIKKLAIKIKDYSPLYASLGWNFDNFLCGGCAGDGDLTKYGEFFISQLNSFNIAVDCAHSNEKSFYSIVSRADRVLCSHTALKWIYPHKRNIDKEQIKVILQKNGIIGLIGVGHFLTGIKGNKKNYEDAFFCHLENYLNEFGSSGLCIGSDFYGSDALVCESGDYSFVKKIVKRLALWGVSSKDINNLLYENAMHFFKLAV